MVSSDNLIRRISWPDVFPWLILFRTIPVAASFSVIVLALIGTVATPAGWMLSELLFVRSSMPDQDKAFGEIVEINRSPYKAIFEASTNQAHSIELFGAQLSGPRAVFVRLTHPFRQLFTRGQGPTRFSYYLVGCVWTLAVWALIGCGITRICLLRLTRDESAGLDDAFEFAVPRFMQCLGAVGLPLIGVFALVLPGLLIGLLMSFDFGLLISSILWIFVLLAGLLMMLLLLGTFFAWPLVISSISAEGQSPLDAITRCFSYVFQRPFHYAFYLLVSVVLGGFCWLIVSQMATGTVAMASWAGSWGSNIANGERMSIILGLDIDQASIDESEKMGQSTAGTGDANTVADPKPQSSNQSMMLWAGSQVVRFWNGFIKTLAVAFLYGLFWCMASGTYLLLRFDVDEVEMDEVFLDESTRSYDIPPLRTDENGIPQISPLDDPE